MKNECKYNCGTGECDFAEENENGDIVCAYGLFDDCYWDNEEEEETEDV